MKKFIILFLILLISPIYANAIDNSKPLASVAIISDHILEPPTVYYNYPASSELFANDISSQLRNRNNIMVKNSSDVKEILKKTTYTPQIKSFLEQYRINYNIDYSKLRPFAKTLGVRNILLITSNIDYQSYIMKGTVWNVIGIGGYDVINPVYQIVTNVSLLDMQNETVVWHNVYRKNLKARDESIVPTAYAPNNQQLKAVSDYSATLSNFVSNAVEEKLCPWLYYDINGNRYNKKSNSLVGKTKYYTQSVYGNYVGVDVPGPPVAERVDKFKANQAKRAEQRRQEKAKKALEAQNQQPVTKSYSKKAKTSKQNDTNNNVNYIEEQEEQQWEEDLIKSNPMREYYQNDNLQIKPERTPDASGNCVEDL